jgi:hypothetical protein
VEDEVRCPKSGYSIDICVHDNALEIGESERKRVGEREREEEEEEAGLLINNQ